MCRRRTKVERASTQVNMVGFLPVEVLVCLHRTVVPPDEDVYGRSRCRYEVARGGTLFCL